MQCSGGGSREINRFLTAKPSDSNWHKNSAPGQIENDNEGRNFVWMINRRTERTTQATNK